MAGVAGPDLRGLIAERLAAGQTPTEIARSLQCSKTTVYRVRDHGVADGRAGNGATSTVSDAQRAAILEIRAAHPDYGSAAIRRILTRRRTRGDLPDEPIPSASAISRVVAIPPPIPATVAAAPATDAVVSIVGDLYGSALDPAERALLPAARGNGLGDEIALIRLQIRRALVSQNGQDPDAPPAVGEHLSNHIAELVAVLVRAIRTAGQLEDHSDDQIDAMIRDYTAKPEEATP